MKIFIICPVRNMTEEEREESTKYIRQLKYGKGKDAIKREALGQAKNEVYFPPVDTNQDDPTGYRICDDNRKAILEADEVHIWYNPTSQGTLFDMGIAWGAKRKIKLINKIERTPQKSFGNVLLEWNEISKNGKECYK